MTALAIIGIFLATYLLYGTWAPSGPTVCHVSSTINCLAITKGNLAYVLGIPVALIGLAGYIAIFVSSLHHWKRAALALTTFGLVFCLRLLYLEIFVEKVVCPICLLCMAAMASVFAISVKLRWWPDQSQPGRPDQTPARSTRSAQSE